MAGVGTPALAAAVSNAGGLGSLGVGATNADGARQMIAEFRALVVCVKFCKSVQGSVVGRRVRFFFCFK
jgi:NAD(P)H-dependent flavin oxidoreductase YrpB (nitropropane dioxygenase family)